MRNTMKLFAVLAILTSGCGNEEQSPTVLDQAANDLPVKVAAEQVAPEPSEADRIQEFELNVTKAAGTVDRLQDAVSGKTSEIDAAEQDIKAIEAEVAQLDRILETVDQNTDALVKQIDRMPGGERARFMQSLALYLADAEKYRTNRAILDILEQFGMISLIDTWKDFAPAYEGSVDDVKAFKTSEEAVAAIGLKKAQDTLEAEFETAQQQLNDANLKIGELSEELVALNAEFAEAEKALLKAEIALDVVRQTAE